MEIVADGLTCISWVAASGEQTDLTPAVSSVTIQLDNTDGTFLPTTVPFFRSSGTYFSRWGINDIGPITFRGKLSAKGYRWLLRIMRQRHPRHPRRPERIRRMHTAYGRRHGRR